MNSLLKTTMEEGKPRQFFGQSKDKKDYQSVSSANFIGGKQQEEEKDESSVNFSVGNSNRLAGASSFGFGMGSKQNLQIDSKDELDKNKAFSFMEGSKQASNKSAAGAGKIGSFQQIAMNGHKGD